MTKYGAKKPREFADLYQTPPAVTRILVGRLGLRSGTAWEPFAGRGKVCRELEASGMDVVASDIIDYGYPLYSRRDFFDWTRDNCPRFDHIISNPPYGPRNSLIVPIVRRALELRPFNGLIAFLLPAEFDSGKRAVSIFRDCPYFRGKIKILGRIVWIEGTEQGGMENHAWFLWGPPCPAPTIDYGVLER